MEEFEKYYRIIDRKRKEKRNLEGISEMKPDGMQPIKKVVIKNWNNWDHSFWVNIIEGEDSIVFDSGVIEELYEEIQKLKKEP